jgi:hypothetical protein
MQHATAIMNSRGGVECKMEFLRCKQKRSSDLSCYELDRFDGAAMGTASITCPVTDNVTYIENGKFWREADKAPTRNAASFDLPARQAVALKSGVAQLPQGESWRAVHGAPGPRRGPKLRGDYFAAAVA